MQFTIVFADLRENWTRLTRDWLLLEGSIAGGLGVALSFMLRRMVPGRLISDPLPLALVPGGLLRALSGNLAYFDWRSPLMHLGFALFLGIASAFVFPLMRRNAPTRALAARVGRLAAAVNIVVAAILEVDAFVVAFYYAISGFVSLSLVGFAAGQLALRAPLSKVRNGEL